MSTFGTCSGALCSVASWVTWLMPLPVAPAAGTTASYPSPKGEASCMPSSRIARSRIHSATRHDACHVFVELLMGRQALPATGRVGFVGQGEALLWANCVMAAGTAAAAAATATAAAAFVNGGVCVV